MSSFCSFSCFLLCVSIFNLASMLLFFHRFTSQTNTHCLSLLPLNFLSHLLSYFVSWICEPVRAPRLSICSDPWGQGGGCCRCSPANVSSLLTILWWEVALNKRAPNPNVWFHPISPSQWEGSFLLPLCRRFLTHHTREKKRLWCLPSP